MHFVALVYSKFCAKFERYSVNGCREIASSICPAWQLRFRNNKQILTWNHINIARVISYQARFNFFKHIPGV